jgi:hypothetical protein
MKRFALTAGAVAFSYVVVGCSGSQEPATPLHLLSPSALSLKTVDWKPASLDLGHITSVVEVDDQIVVFGDSGATALAANAVVATDPSVKAWVSATNIPAADGSGTWTVGVGGDGQLYWFRARTELENVSDRYGLTSDSVLDVSAAGDSIVVFRLKDSIAIADGKTVTRYDGSLASVTGNNRKVAGAGGGRVVVIDPVASAERSYPLANAAFVAYDATGRLFAATDHRLYAASPNGDLDPLYDAGTATIHGMAAAGSRVWMAVDKRVGYVEQGQLHLATADVIAPDANIVGSASGDIWTVASGQLTHLAVDGDTSDVAVWERTMVPIFSRVCSSCHLPGGTAGIDLSSYASWQARRALIGQRVIDQKPTPMPPADSGYTLTDEERQAIAAWVKSGG